MRYTLHSLLFCLLALGPINLASANTREIIDLDYIVAVVNTDVITSSELTRKTDEIRRQLRAQRTQLPPESILRKQVLERMIVEKIQVQQAQQSGIRISDENLNQVIVNIAKQNNMQLETFRQALINDGYDFASFREEIRKEMLITQLRKRKVENKVFVSEQEVNNQLAKLGDRAKINTEYRLGHILIAIPESAKPTQVEQAQQQAREALTHLNLGADFGQTAMRISAGQEALRGGDIGWIKEGQLPTIFADTIPSMTVGEITQPIRSPSGFHIVKLIDKRSPDSRHLIKQTLARHILIKPSAITSEEQAKAKLQRIRQRVLDGADFGTIAKASSDDTGSATQGGDLGWVSPGQMVSEFEEELGKLKAGEISEPFQSRFGWHIIQVLSHREYDDTEQYYKNQARSLIHKRKVKVEVTNWLRRIRDEAYVEVRLEE